jgi:hypothetical protein
MAKVYLRSYDGKEIVDLPPVCMRCGAPATFRKSKQFSWIPPWVGGLVIIPLAYIVVAAVVTKRQRVETTFCDRHKSYWWFFPLMMWLSVLGIFGLGALLTVALAAAAPKNGGDMAGFGCVAVFGSLIIVGIIAAIFNSTRIRAGEITDRHIHLNGVCDEFADAVEELEQRQRDAFDRGYDNPREPRRRGRDDDDDRYSR